MPKGTENSVALVIKALHEDQGMQALFVSTDATGQGGESGTVKVYRDTIPPTVTYQFIFLQEAKESEVLRDSETVGGANPSFVEFKRMHLIAFAVGGDLPWAIGVAARAVLMNRDPATRSAYFQADLENDPDDKYTLEALTESDQELLGTDIKDEYGRDVYQSTQTFLLYTKKKGGA